MTGKVIIKASTMKGTPSAELVFFWEQDPNEKPNRSMLLLHHLIHEAIHEALKKHQIENHEAMVADIQRGGVSEDIIKRLEGK